MDNTLSVQYIMDAFVAICGKQSSLVVKRVKPSSAGEKGQCFLVGIGACGASIGRVLFILVPPYHLRGTEVTTKLRPTQMPFIFMNML